eukprot:6492723-Amphidinium_carterae.3
MPNRVKPVVPLAANSVTAVVMAWRDASSGSGLTECLLNIAWTEVSCRYGNKIRTICSLSNCPALGSKHQTPRTHTIGVQCHSELAPAAVTLPLLLQLHLALVPLASMACQTYPDPAD